MNGVCPVELLLKILVVVESLQFLKEDLEVLLNFLCRLGADMVRDRLTLLLGVQLQRLADFLIVSSVPVDEATVKKDLLLDPIFLCEVNKVDTLKVPTVLRLVLFLYEIFQTLRSLEEAIVLH